MVELLHRELTDRILRCAIDVHKELGPGLLESAYQVCLAHALKQEGLDVQREVALPVRFRGITLDCGYRLDVVVDDQVIVECKAVETILPVHEAQLLTYLRLSGKRVGLLLNFITARLKDGLRRVVL